MHDLLGCPRVATGPAGLDRRDFVHLLALALGAPSAAALIAGCGDDPSGMDGPMGGDMSGGMMGGDAMDGRMMRDMRVIRDLLAGHGEIERTVDDIPGGIRSATASEDDELAELIQAHVGQMKQRLQEGDPIRSMDPLFREIFEHAENLRLDIESVSCGVRVTETSDDPQATLLIRQHARHAVSEFVESGMSRAMQPTPLPEGYEE
jgi:hypothetical protein